MNRAELISAVSDATALPRAQVDATLSAVLDQIVAATAAGQKTTLMGFGSFQPMDRSARAGRNPATGEALQIPANEPHRVLGRACDLQAQPETVLPALVARLWLQACAVDVAQLSLVLRMPERHTLGLCPRTTEVRMTLPPPAPPPGPAAT